MGTEKSGAAEIWTQILGSGGPYLLAKDSRFPNF